MFPDEKIIGPLSFKQFIYLAVGALLAYGAYKYLSSPFSIIASLVIIFFAFAKAFITNSENSFDFADIDHSIAVKTAELGVEKVTKELQKKSAEVASQIEMRSIRGLSPDPMLLEVQKKLETAIQKLESGNRS